MDGSLNIFEMYSRKMPCSRFGHGAHDTFIYMEQFQRNFDNSAMSYDRLYIFK